MSGDTCLSFLCSGTVFFFTYRGARMISDFVSDPLSPGARDRAKVLRLTENPVQEQISGGITQTLIEGINCHQI